MGKAVVVSQPNAETPRAGAIGLSGKLLILTALFVMLSEILIFVPSAANFRLQWLAARFENAELAAQVWVSAPRISMTPAQQMTILRQAGVKAITVKRTAKTQLRIADEMADNPMAIFRITDIGWTRAIAQAFDTLANRQPRFIMIVGATELEGSEQLKVVVDETLLRQAMLQYSANILSLSIVISIITAALVYISIHWLTIRPVRRLSEAMRNFSSEPENPNNILHPSARRDEIGITERQFRHMQADLSSALQQKARLAALGLAVAKINHDLRNILSSAHLISDRLTQTEDPAVRNAATKIVAALDRAVGLCHRIIKYGQADEPTPSRHLLPLAPLADEVAEAIGLADHPEITWRNRIEQSVEIDADPDQLYRILMNLCRNARQAHDQAERRHSAHVTIDAEASTKGVRVSVYDNGPGIPPMARAHLFQAFQGSARPGGVGLGLPIAAELARAHGGSLVHRDLENGTAFTLFIPHRTPPHQ